MECTQVNENPLAGNFHMGSLLRFALPTILFNMVMLRLMGESGVAAITIMIYTQFLLTTLYIGFSMGVAPVISYNYGRGDRLRGKRIFKISLIFIVSVSGIVFLMSMIFGTSLIGIFSVRGTAVYEIACGGFRIFSLSFLFCGMNIFVSAFFTALSNGKASAVISLLRTFVFLVFFLHILPLVLGETGVWLAVPMAELNTMFVSIFLILRLFRLSCGN